MTKPTILWFRRDLRLSDQEALRVIRTMPAWEPGVLEGKVVNVRMEVPIVFMQTMERMN